MPETRESILFSMKNMNKVYPVAVDLLEKAKERNRFALMGKRPRILVAAAIYLAGLLTGNSVRQEALALFFGTAAVSIRLRYVELARLLGYEYSTVEGHLKRSLRLDLPVHPLFPLDLGIPLLAVLFWRKRE